MCACECLCACVTACTHASTQTWVYVYVLTILTLDKIIYMHTCMFTVDTFSFFSVRFLCCSDINFAVYQPTKVMSTPLSPM